MPEPSEREIIQIAVGSSDDSDLILALCSDGSLWGKRVECACSKWERINGIPAEECDENGPF